MSERQDVDERNEWAGVVEERRDLALEAAVGVADALGVRAGRPAILADSNNTIVWLAPAPIVAKVGTSHFRDAELESLARELAVATHLSGLGAPVVAPARGVRAGPYRWRDLTVTLWEYAEPSGEVALEPAEAAAVMRAVHEALAVFPGSLPHFDMELADARRLLRPERSPTLPDSDRHFLLSVIGEVEKRLGGRVTEPRALHGSPHAGNWLRTTQGLLLLDFETACRGPLEWDLAALDGAVAQLFAKVDFELVALLRRMRSVCVAAKCWVEPNRAAEVREAARVHLKLLRGESLD
jgi:phosphotransferase family enzyme